MKTGFVIMKKNLAARHAINYKILLFINVRIEIKIVKFFKLKVRQKFFRFYFN